jgi:hypothetical protein
MGLGAWTRANRVWLNTTGGYLISTAAYDATHHVFPTETPRPALHRRRHPPQDHGAVRRRLRRADREPRPQRPAHHAAMRPTLPADPHRHAGRRRRHRLLQRHRHADDAACRAPDPAGRRQRQHLGAHPSRRLRPGHRHRHRQADRHRRARPHHAPPRAETGARPRPPSPARSPRPIPAARPAARCRIPCRRCRCGSGGPRRHGRAPGRG